MTHRLSKEQWRAALDSDDEAAVISALHQACPCSGSPALYEAFRARRGAYKTAPRRGVRGGKNALARWERAEQGPEARASGLLKMWRDRAGA